ncbi:hypothetical protein F5Y07DRAFT_354554 [Xylaria sp. FL0933]|nr:hypothetical protein F5Y07DRAFT_354554 [Xylaria sp. FL0933]
MELTKHNIVSIVQIIFFIPSLAISLLLCKRHGFGANAGWLLLVIFSLSRIIGASLQLAATAQPDNIGLFFGALTLQGVGLSDFIIVMLALINRALASTKEARTIIINPSTLRLAQLLVLVGVILGIYGGTTAGDNYAKTGQYEVSTYTQAGSALTIAGFGIVVIATALLGINLSYLEAGEKRVVLAVALSLPFLLIRVIYSALGTFQSQSEFSSLTGNVNYFIGLAVIEEFIIIIIIEGLGLTFSVRPKTDEPSGSRFGGLFGVLKRRYGGYQPQSLGEQGGNEMHRLNRRARRHDRYNVPSPSQSGRYEGYRSQGYGPGPNQTSGQYDGYEQRLSQSPPGHEGARPHRGASNV